VGSKLNEPKKKEKKRKNDGKMREYLG